MPYVPDDTIAGFKSSGRRGLFFRLDTSPALHLSFSINSIPIAMPNYDDPGTVYLGAGRLLDIPQLEVLLNGVADTVQITLNGVDQALTAAMLGQAPAVQGAIAVIGIAAIDQLWQPIGSIIPIWTGFADTVGQEITIETDPTKNRTQSLSLTLSTGDTSRQIPSNLTYSDATQKTLHPGDDFCQRTILYRAQTFTIWPRY